MKSLEIIPLILPMLSDPITNASYQMMEWNPQAMHGRDGQSREQYALYPIQLSSL